MPRDDQERLTLDGDDDVQGVDAAVVKELSKQIRWSAMALGKIEGFFDQIVKNSESSEARMVKAATGLREELRTELDEVKGTLEQVTERLRRVEGSVREMKVTEEGLVQECNRKWEACSPLNLPQSAPGTDTQPQPPQPLPPGKAGWVQTVLQGIFKQPIYLAITGLILAFVVLALMVSDDLRSWLVQLFG